MVTGNRRECKLSQAAKRDQGPTNRRFFLCYRLLTLKPLEIDSGKKAADKAEEYVYYTQKSININKINLRFCGIRRSDLESHTVDRKKSCTSWCSRYPSIHSFVLYIPGGFLPGFLNHRLDNWQLFPSWGLMSSKEEANFVANYLGNLANSWRMWVNFLVVKLCHKWWYFGNRISLVCFFFGFPWLTQQSLNHIPELM